MIRKYWLAFGLMLIALLGAAAQAQTGSIDPTASQLSGLPSFTPPAIELIEEPVVDLRPWMPPVGLQQMNDCTAWAMAYGARSYHEARDQNWKPNAPSRIFSPTFIYNQINGGKDDGSNFVKAVQLMQVQGAATLATAPYLPRNFTAQPSERAKAEAKAYRVHGLRLMRDRQSIRRSIQRRDVVVFGAHVNPLFLSGRFDIYTRALFLRDQTQRQPNQIHGKHAMVIVGYDDQKQAFLIQNSWGTQWGQRGYGWVAYELFDDIRIAEDSENVFCNWAAIMIDIQEPLEIGPDGLPRSRPMDLSALRVTGFSDLVRFESRYGKFLYSFQAELRGQAMAMEQVQEVTWRWINPLGEVQTLTSDMADSRFGFRAGTFQNPMTLDALVKFKNGTSRTFRGTIEGPSPKAEFREANIEFEHHYFGMGGPARNIPMYQWRVKLNYPLNQRDDIIKVIWDFGSMMDGQWEVLDRHNGPQADVRPSGINARPDRITATITYADGGVKKVTYDPVFDEPVFTEMDVDVSYREMGRDQHNRMQYGWTLTLRRPRQLDFGTKAGEGIRFVDYVVDPGASDRHWHLRSNSFSQDFAVSGAAYRDFRVNVTVIFNDGSQKTFERWIELGPEARYLDPNRVELIASDVYQGLYNEKPSWIIRYQVLGDRQQLARISKVQFHRPAEYEDGPTYTKQQLTEKFNHGLATESFLRHDAMELGATVTFDDGRTSKLKLHYAPQSSPNELLGIMIDGNEEANLYNRFDRKPLHRYHAKLMGPKGELDRVTRVDWYQHVRKQAERTLNTGGIQGDIYSMSFLGGVNEPSPLTARVYFTDGYEQFIYAATAPGYTGLARSALDLEIREKFLEYDENLKPWWTAEIRVAGDAKVMQRIRNVQYTTRNFNGPQIFGPWDYPFNAPFGVSYSAPSEITAIITYEDGSTQELKARARADAARPAAELQLIPIRHKNWRQGVHLWSVYVDGYETVRSMIAKVVFKQGDVTRTLTYEKDKVPRTIYENFTHDMEKPITAQVTLQDGRLLDLTLTLPQLQKGIGWAWQQGEYWGDGKWEVSAYLTGTLDARSSVGIHDHFYSHDHKLRFHNVPSWPDHLTRLDMLPGEYQFRAPQVATGWGNWFSLWPDVIKVVERPEQRIDTLTLRVVRSPHQPASGQSDEWRVYIHGPQRDMHRIREVHYESVIDGHPVSIDIGRRWGEFFAGYEHRYIVRDQPSVKATITFNDGRTQTLTFTP